MIVIKVKDPPLTLPVREGDVGGVGGIGIIGVIGVVGSFNLIHPFPLRGLPLSQGEKVGDSVNRCNHSLPYRGGMGRGPHLVNISLMVGWMRIVPA